MRVGDDVPVSTAAVEPVVPVGASLVSADPSAFVIVEESLEPVADAAEASKVVLMLEAVKRGYGPVIKFPCRPSGSV